VTSPERLSLADLGGRATVTVEEVAQVLGVSRGSAYEGVRTGALPSLRLGRRVLVPVPRLLALLGADDSGVGS
jgi:excisionase family DNA binding protein